jgi:hypothetical protein
MTFWVAGAAVVGGALSYSAAGDAIDSQEAGAARSDATQRYQYDTTRADNAPFRETGVAANNRLSYLMGLDGGSSSSAPQTREQMRAQLAPKFTTAGTAATAGTAGYWDANANQHDSVGGFWAGGTPGTAAVAGSIDEAGLNSAIDRQMAKQAAQANDPSYGSLTRNFTMADRDADPVYQSGLQFGLDEGTKGINRQAAAGGNFLSGATLKALTRFGNDYGSTKANESYNRFNTNNNQQYNRLAGLSGAGQQATNQVSAAGGRMADSISQSQQGVGNARGSSYIAQGNTWQNALNSGVSAWNNRGTNSLSSWNVPSNADTTIPMQPGGGY